jgi:hypothetical protein
MGISGGPYIVRDSSLVLELDAADKNSYIGSGTLWNDLSGNNNTGSLNNSPTFSNDNGGIIIFDGTNDYSVSSYTWPTIFTLSMWVYFIAGSDTYPRIISSAPNFNFELAINNSGQISYYPSVPGAWTENVATVSKNTWINLVAVNNNDNFTLYRNGSSIYTGTIGVRALSTQFYIATNYNLSGERTNIRVSNLQIYNRALSATEILQNYNELKSRFGL